MKRYDSHGYDDPEGVLVDFDEAQSEITAAYQRGLEDAAIQCELVAKKECGDSATAGWCAARIRAKKEGGR